MILAVICLFVAVASGFPNKDLQDPLSNFQDPILNIVGGQVATAGQFPWQLHLKLNGAFICGAVLVTANRALTAAHCLRAGTFTATAGEHNTQSTSGNEVTLPVYSYTMHPSFSAGNGYPNDIAILRFTDDFPINSYILPIAMAPSSSSDFTGTTCTISGWGRTIGGGNFPNILHYTSMPAITNSECESRWIGISGAYVNSGHICVYQSGKSACHGDSGGPMVCSNLLAGITSWGVSTCSGGYPSVYSRISVFRSWVNNNL